jgi:hypothetical protein
MSESLTPLNFMVPERQSHEVVTAFCLLDLTLVVVLLDGSTTSTCLRFASSPTTLISPCILLHHNMSPPFFPSLHVSALHHVTPTPTQVARSGWFIGGRRSRAPTPPSVSSCCLHHPWHVRTFQIMVSSTTLSISFYYMCLLCLPV